MHQFASIHGALIAENICEKTFGGFGRMKLIKGAVAIWFGLCLILHTEDTADASRADNMAILLVKTSPDAARVTAIPLMSRHAFERRVRRGVRRPVRVVPVSDIYVTLKGKGKPLSYLVDRQGNLFEENQHNRIELDKSLRKQIKASAEKLRSLHYGKLVKWDEADHEFPKHAIFNVVDMETGLSFHVQRRAGRRHADVQPLTQADTAVMKQIYNGEWSWRRKAILIERDGKLFAASMHGMPHGGDGIPDNGFSGHFCIHFLGSTTHGSGNVDPEHQLMIYKAAGRLHEWMDGASPGQVADAFWIALNRKEMSLLNMCLSNPEPLQYFLQADDPITGIRRKSPPFIRNTAGLLVVEFPVQVGIKREHLREQRLTLNVRLVRYSLFDPWKIDDIAVGT
jgi:hypothetical protein